MKPILAITIGDPLGIGPEVCLKAFPNLKKFSRPIFFGHRSVLACAAALIKRRLPPDLMIREPPLEYPFKKPTRRAAGAASLSYIQTAVTAWRSGQVDALVTSPICKEHIQKAGCPYPGHTEILAAATNSHKTFLMMVGPHLKVTLVTLHIPLQQVPKTLSTSLIVQASLLTHQALQRRFGIKRPRLAMAGLNPHAGEAGLFGSEEKTKVIPAVRELRRKKIAITGPLSPDTVYYQAVQGHYDAAISLYHDQGLIPIKLLDFDQAVNMTLGLPLIRTSVDHGTAFDIAWQNRANPESLIAAAELAAKLVRKK